MEGQDLTSQAIEGLRSSIAPAIDLVPVALLVTEKDGNAVGFNAAWTELTGLDHQGSVGLGWSALLSAEDRARLLGSLVASNSGNTTTLGDYPLRKAGGRRWSRWTAHDLGDEPLIVMAVVDIDADHARAEALRRAATLDSLTGLVNRAELLQLTAQALRGDPTAVGMCYVDLDAFKTVNDTSGHLLGDQVLAAAAGRLAAEVRPSDVVARVGGDEFAVLVHGVAHAPAVAGRLAGAFADPIVAGGVEWPLGATVGFAAGHHSQTAEELLAAADAAMYAAKKESRKPDPDPHGATTGRSGLSMDVANGLIHQIFSVGLTLTSTAELADGVIADRLTCAVDELDRIILCVRNEMFDSDAHAGADPATSADDLPQLGADPLVKQISLLLTHIDRLSDAATHADGQRSVHLLDASHSMHRSLIDLTTHLDSSVDTSNAGSHV